MTNTEVREKLAELIAEARRQWEGGTNNIDLRIADHLIANGVTLQEPKKLSMLFADMDEIIDSFFDSSSEVIG